eukprot:4931118-Pyramimonas_sp.AAC.2
MASPATAMAIGGHRCTQRLVQRQRRVQLDPGRQIANSTHLLAEVDLTATFWVGRAATEFLIIMAAIF